MRSLLQLLRTKGERRDISRNERGDAEQHCFLCKLITHPKQSQFRFILAQRRAEPSLLTEGDTDRYSHKNQTEQGVKNAHLEAAAACRGARSGASRGFPACWELALGSLPCLPGAGLGAPSPQRLQVLHSRAAPRQPWGASASSQLRGSTRL